MTKDELVNSLQKRDPLLANAVSNMVDYISDRFPAAYPSKEQTEAVNTYLHSVYADGDGAMSERNCEHRRIASQKITINAIQVLDSPQLDRLQRVLDHIAYDKEYYMPERGFGKSNTMTSTTAFPNKEDPPIKNGGTSPTQLANSSFSSLTSGNGDNGEEEDVPPPSVSDMELEAEARRQFFKEQMEAEDAPQLLLLG